MDTEEMRSNFNRLATWAGVGLALVQVGCGPGFWEDPTRAAQGEREDFLILEERYRQLAGRIESLEYELGAQRRDWEQERVRGHVEGPLAERVRSLEQRIEGLERRLGESEAARERDRREIVDVLSRRMAELLQVSTTATTRAGTPVRRGDRSGWEHEVKPGESLSAIAAAYGVRVSDIVAANQLRDADRIRVGQKLFIPAP